MLVFTDGVDMPLNFASHNKSLKDVMKRAEEENVMVYAIGLAGENGMPGRAAIGRPGLVRADSVAPAGSAAAAVRCSTAAADRSWRSPTKGCRRSPRLPAAAISS